MRHYHAPLALLPDGWARGVRLVVDGSGALVEVLAGDGDVRGARPAGIGDPPGVDNPAGGERATRVESLPGVVVPGVPDLHSHAFQRALAGRTERGSAAGESFWSWRERMYRSLTVLEPDDVDAVAAQVYVELLRHGYTAVAEFHYLHLDPAGRPYDDPAELARRVLAAADRAGIGLTLLPVLYRSSDFGGTPADPGQRRFVLDEDAFQDLLVGVSAACAEHPDRRAGLALHSLRAVPPDAFDRALTAWDALDPEGPVHVHAAEQRREVEGCLAWSGRRPVAWLLEHVPMDARWCVVHATHLDDTEVTELARSGAVAGLCPSTEANLGDGLFRLPEYLRAGGSWGIGSDRQVGTSPAEELRWLEYGQRLIHERRAVAAGDADRSTARVLLEGAWAGGARACGRPLGELAVGGRADWVVLDSAHPTLAGLDGDALLDGWIFAGNDSPVREVWVGGRRVVADGRHAREEEVAARYRETMERLARRV
jgi:formimidoylglutamate deiminase